MQSNNEVSDDVDGRSLKWGPKEQRLTLPSLDGTFQAKEPATDEPLKSPWMDTEGANVDDMNLSGQKTESAAGIPVCAFYFGEIYVLYRWTYKEKQKRVF